MGEEETWDKQYIKLITFTITDILILINVTVFWGKFNAMQRFLTHKKKKNITSNVNMMTKQGRTFITHFTLR